MPNPESREQPYDCIAEIRNDLAHAEELIQAELNRTRNPWIACFVTRVQVVSGNLDLAKRSMQIDNETYDAAKKVIDSLNEQISHWRTKTEKSGARMLPDEAKDQLMSAFNLLKPIFEQEGA